MIKTTLRCLAVSLIFVIFTSCADESTDLKVPPNTIKPTSKCNDIPVGDAAPLEAQIDTAFSPDGGGRTLVIKFIHAAKKTIRLSAYSFTSPSIARALVDAKCRGVDVAVVVDFTSNIVDDRNGRAHAALNLLVAGGISPRTISTYPIHHDKFIISDSLHVETGSYNYSESAAWRNSENVLVVWNNPQVAASYLKHWQSRYEQGQAYTAAP